MRTGNFLQPSLKAGKLLIYVAVADDRICRVRDVVAIPIGVDMAVIAVAAIIVVDVHVGKIVYTPTTKDRDKIECFIFYIATRRSRKSHRRMVFETFASSRSSRSSRYARRIYITGYYYLCVERILLCIELFILQLTDDELTSTEKQKNTCSPKQLVIENEMPAKKVETRCLEEGQTRWN